MQGDRQTEKRYWAKSVENGRRDALQSARRLGVSIETFRIIVLSMCSNDSKKVSAMVARIAASILNGIQKLRLEQAVRNGYVYGQSSATLVAEDMGPASHSGLPDFVLKNLR